MRIDQFRRSSLAVLFLATIHAAPITFQVKDLGSLGGSSASANSINASGQTTGSASNIYGDSRAMSGTADITPAGAQGAIGSGINNGGQIAGTTFSGNIAQATVWTNGAPQYLGTLGGSDAFAMGINNLGRVTGMSVTGQGFGHAFISAAGGLMDLGVLGGGEWSSGYGINDSGQVVGYGDTGSGSFRGFRWSPGGAMSAIGTFGGANSYAMGINGAGQVAGSAQTSSGYMRAFLLDSQGMQNLGTLGGGSSYGYGINSAGSEVGYSNIENGDNRAFLYLGGILYDLNTLLSGSAGWVLTEAYGINDANQIVGSGLFNGVEHAFRLDPIAKVFAAALVDAPVVQTSAVPEPGTMLLTAAAGGVIFVWRRKRR